jgi:hypothetical protein
MDVGGVADISVVHAASIFRTEVYRLTEFLRICTFMFRKNHRATVSPPLIGGCFET